MAPCQRSKKPDAVDSAAIKKCIRGINKTARILSETRKTLLHQREFLKLVLSDANLVENDSADVGLYNLWHPYQASLDVVTGAMGITTAEVEDMEDHLVEQEEAAGVDAALAQEDADAMPSKNKEEAEEEEEKRAGVEGHDDLE